MRRALRATMALIAIACGGPDPVTDDSAAPARSPEHQDQENRPPYVEAIAITPEEPSAEDALGLALRVIDADRDRLSIDVVWYRNGSVYDDSGRQSIDPGEFQRGDSVWAEVLISDGTEEIEVTTDPVAIRNAAPRIDAIRFDPPQPTAADVIDARIEGSDADGDRVKWSYRWRVDGKILPGVNTTRLPAGLIKRGSRVAIEVSGDDGNSEPEWTASGELSIANAAPRILTQPVYGLAAPGRYLYEIQAKDADGDEPLRFQLLEGPPGMEIDPATGALSWLLQRDAKGSFPVEVAVSDSQGARALQRWSLDVEWQAADESQLPQGPAAAAPGEAEDESASETDGSEGEDF